MARIPASGEARDWWTPTETAAWTTLSARAAAQAATRTYQVEARMVNPDAAIARLQAL